MSVGMFEGDVAKVNDTLHLKFGCSQSQNHDHMLAA